jgi:hypothetical protein
MDEIVRWICTVLYKLQNTEHVGNRNKSQLSSSQDVTKCVTAQEVQQTHPPTPPPRLTEGRI